MDDQLTEEEFQRFKRNLRIALKVAVALYIMAVGYAIYKLVEALLTQ